MQNYNFCPVCKTKLIKEEECLECPSCGNKIYLNPTPAVSFVPIKNGKALLTKRGIEPYKGDWDVFGGFMKYEETIEETIRREFKEESGLEIKSMEYFGSYTERYGKDGEHTISIFFVGKPKGKNLKVKDDVADAIWVPIRDLDKIKSHFKSVEKALSDLKMWYPTETLRKY